jgi:hypothetical protein
MKQTTMLLLNSRTTAPERLRGPDFDGWLFGLIVESLEPMQRDVLLWLMAAHPEEMTSADLVERGNSTPQRIGAAVSDLRRFDLVWTIRSRGVVYHALSRWARGAAAMWQQMQSEPF